MNEQINQELHGPNWEARRDGRKRDRNAPRDCATGRFVSMGYKAIRKPKNNWYQENKAYVSWKAKQRRLTHGQEIRDRKRMHRLNNPDLYRKWGKEWADKNQEKLKASRRRYYLKHKDRILLQTSDYTKSHPEQRKLAQSRYNTSNKGRSTMRTWARTKGKLPNHYAVKKLSETKRRNLEQTACLPDANKAVAKLVSLKKWICYYCGTKITNRSDMHIDHVKPISKGGLHAAYNLVPACAKCNLTKANKSANNVFQQQVLVW